jgi:hypothetical protein
MMIDSASAIARLDENGKPDIIGASITIGHDTLKAWTKFLKFHGFDDITSHAAECFLKIAQEAGYGVIYFGIDVDQLSMESHARR